MTILTNLSFVLADAMEPRLFNLDFQLLHDSVLSMIAVLFLTVFLSKMLFNPARKMINDRKEKIKNELDQAATTLQKANEMKVTYEGKLHNVDKEAEEILSIAHRKAKESEQKIVQEAKDESVRIMHHTKSEVELEKHKMADEVKKEMIAVAAVMAGKIASASMNQEEQNKLLEETLKDIGDQTWQN